MAAWEIAVTLPARKGLEGCSLETRIKKWDGSPKPACFEWSGGRNPIEALKFEAIEKDCRSSARPVSFNFMFKFREKVIVRTPEGKIEGYVHAILSPKEVYVVLTGQNTRPVLVDTRDVVSIDNPIKRGRGRPRKESK